MPQHHAPPASGGRPATKRQTDRRGASSGALRPVRNPVWLVGLGIFLVYCATVSGEGGSTYGQAYLTAESLVKTGDLSIDAAGSDVSVNTIGITAVNAAGERYAVTGVLWSLLLVPFYLAGQALAPLAGAGAQDIIAKLLTGLYDPLLWAVCGMLLFSLARRMSGSGTRAWVVVLLWTFATMTWGVSKYSSYLSLLSCLLLGLLWFVVLPNRSPTPLRFLGGGPVLWLAGPRPDAGSRTPPSMPGVPRMESIAPAPGRASTESAGVYCPRPCGAGRRCVVGCCALWLGAPLGVWIPASGAGVRWAMGVPVQFRA